METAFLVGTLLTAIALVVFLIMKLHIQAFVSLIIACFYVGFVTNMPLIQICKSIEAGMGGTLGFLATVLGFGTILGKMLETSGGAERLARTLIAKFGQKRANWAMMFVGLITGIPVLFQVGFVLLIPLVISVAKATGLSIVAIGVPIGISLHCAAVGGPIWTKFISRGIKSDLETARHNTGTVADEDLPHFGITLLTILLPMLIMASKTIFDLSSLKGSPVGLWVDFIGNPITALLISAFFAYWSLGLHRGKTMKDLLKFTEQSFAPVAGILLVIGAGGAFNKILLDSGLGTQLGAILTSLDMNPLLLAWFVAAVMRFSIGSATVAMMTSAGIVLPMLGQYPNLDPAVVCLAVGSGAICFSHVTDSGFWIVKEYFGLTVEGALKSYTAATCLASVTAIGDSVLSFIKVRGSIIIFDKDVPYAYENMVVSHTKGTLKEDIVPGDKLI